MALRDDQGIMFKPTYSIPGLIVIVHATTIFLHSLMSAVIYYDVT